MRWADLPTPVASGAVPPVNGKSTVTAGKSAVVIYATKLTEDKFAAALTPYNGTVVQTSLSEEDEKELIHDLGGR